MDCLRTFPGVGESFISRRGYVGSDERVHRLRGDISRCLTSSCNLSHLGVKNSLLKRVNFKCCKHIDFLDEQRRCVLLSELLGNLRQDPCRISVLVGLAIELDGFHLLVLLHQVGSVPLEELLNLQEVVLLGKLHSLIPLVQQHAAIDRLLNVA